MAAPKHASFVCYRLSGPEGRAEAFGAVHISKLTRTMAFKLNYADIDAPGMSRRLIRGRCVYFDINEDRIVEPDEITRLNSIALPPAYTDAWFSADPHAHILATGIDARGRKQYRYHPDFRKEQDSRKFGSCAEFGRHLPQLRQRVEKGLGKRNLSAERALASIVKLLDCGHIRVGNESYTRSNGSFGATTLRARHAQLDRDRLTLRFRAKSGKHCKIAVRDRGLIRFVKQVQDLPGQHLFQYVDAEENPHPICSTEVNVYIRTAMGADFTAKDFRTWGASVLAFEYLIENEGCTLGEMLAHVAQGLGNTPAIARKSYVHPGLVELAKSGTFKVAANELPRRTKWLTRHERGLIALLDELD